MSLSKYEIQKKISHYSFTDRIKIGNFVFDENSRNLTLAGREFHLRNKLFEILCFLIYSNGKLIHRNAMIESIWKNNHVVGQKSLTHGICELRKILAYDPINHVQIITVAKTGYLLRQ